MMRKHISVALEYAPSSILFIHFCNANLKCIAQIFWFYEFFSYFYEKILINFELVPRRSSSQL